MSMEALWYFTQMPPELISLVEKDLQQFDSKLNTAQTAGGASDSSIEKDTATVLHGGCSRE